MNIKRLHHHLKPIYPGLISFAITAALLAAWPAQARAQTEGAARLSTAEADHIILGAGIAVAPAYQGADDYRVIPMPLIDIRKGWLVANLRNGIGISPINTDHVTLGASAVFIQGYRRRDVPQGIDRLSDGVGARLFANLRAGGLIATIGATKGLSGGTQGMIADLSLSYPLVVSQRLVITPTLGTTWANRKHNDRYFGVTPTEAAASGLPQYSAGAGFKDASAALTLSYRINDRIMLSATGLATTLLAAVNDSPQIEKKTQPAGFITLGYRF